MRASSGLSSASLFQLRPREGDDCLRPHSIITTLDSDQDHLILFLGWDGYI